MARVLTNNTGLRVAIESSVGVLPAEPTWSIVEYNNITAFGAVITTVQRRPISQDRGRRKGVVTDLDSSVEYETDITLEALILFGEGFMFAEYSNVEFELRETYGVPAVPRPPRVDGTTEDFDIDAATALLAGKVQWVTASYSTLIWTKGYTNAANNGLHELSADLGLAGVAVEVTSNLVTEVTPPANAICRVAGVRVMNDADLTLTVTGPTATLVSAAAIANWATLGLTPGQYIHIGSTSTTGALQFGLGALGVGSFGYARITSIAGATINLDKLSPTLISAVGGAGLNQDVIFGRFLRNVPTTADLDDERYLERTYQFEASFPDLGGVGTPEYEYAIGNFANELTFNLPLTALATGSIGFVGTNSDPITGVRKNNAEEALAPLLTNAFSSSANLASITTDVIAAVSDVCFKNLTLTLLNNVSPEKCLGTLGATFVNAGLFQADIEGQMLFTSAAIVNAIRNNTTVTLAWILENEDGGVVFDIPAMTLSGGGREFPVDQSVLVNITGASFTSNFFGYDIGISFFDAVPGALALSS